MRTTHLDASFPDSPDYKHLQGAQFLHDGLTVTLDLGMYENLRLAIKVVACEGAHELLSGRRRRDDDPYPGECVAKLTVNLSDLAEPRDGEVHVKAWGENEGIVRSALASGLFADTGSRVTIPTLRSGGPVRRVEAHVWRVVDPPGA